MGTDAIGHVVDGSGQPLDWLWAIGSLRQGQLLESTAVPEIRGQAQDIADQVLRHIRGGGQYEAFFQDEQLASNY